MSICLSSGRSAARRVLRLLTRLPPCGVRPSPQESVGAPHLAVAAPRAPSPPNRPRLTSNYSVGRTCVGCLANFINSFFNNYS